MGKQTNVTEQKELKSRQWKLRLSGLTRRIGVLNKQVHLLHGFKLPGSSGNSCACCPEIKRIYWSFSFLVYLAEPEAIDENASGVQSLFEESGRLVVLSLQTLKEARLQKFLIHRRSRLRIYQIPVLGAANCKERIDSFNEPEEVTHLTSFNPLVTWRLQTAFPRPSSSLSSAFSF